MNFVRSFVRPASRILPGFRAASLTHLPQQQQQANLRLSATRFNALPRGFSSAASAEASVEEAAPSKDSKAIPFNEPFTPRKVRARLQTLTETGTAPMACGPRDDIAPRLLILLRSRKATILAFGLGLARGLVC